MTTQFDTVGEQGLRFFGSITASVSHELKNALAIIKENAGLLNDYLFMAEQGRPLEPARLKTVATRIEDQTRRADTLIKYLNRFAHTVDDFDKNVDLNDLLDLLVTLCARSAAMRQVVLESRPAPVSVMVTTAPFVLLTVLGRYFLLALETLQAGDTLAIGVIPNKGAGLYFEPSVGLAGISQERFAREPQATLLAKLTAASEVDLARGRICITLN